MTEVINEWWKETDYLKDAKNRFPCVIGNRVYTLKEFLEGYIVGIKKRNTFVQIPRETVKKDESLAFA